MTKKIDISFIIFGSLPTLNEVIKKSKQHWSSYARMKKDATRMVSWSSYKIEPITKKIDIKIIWICKNKKTDPDNISGGGTKMILDGLIEAGVIENDGWNQIGRITHEFEIGKQPMIIVHLKEMED